MLYAFLILPVHVKFPTNENQWNYVINIGVLKSTHHNSCDAFTQIFNYTQTFKILERAY
jgi:hypothetical protein